MISTDFLVVVLFPTKLLAMPKLKLLTFSHLQRFLHLFLLLALQSSYFALLSNPRAARLIRPLRTWSIANRPYALEK